MKLVQADRNTIMESMTHFWNLRAKAQYRAKHLEILADVYGAHPSRINADGEVFERDDMNFATITFKAERNNATDGTVNLVTIITFKPDKKDAKIMHYSCESTEYKYTDTDIHKKVVYQEEDITRKLPKNMTIELIRNITEGTKWFQRHYYADINNYTTNITEVAAQFIHTYYLGLIKYPLERLYYPKLE